MEHFKYVSFVALIFLTVASVEGLVDYYYSSSCSSAESVIQTTVNAELDKDLQLAAGLIRMQFHDCFVEGCDASILLDGDGTEKASPVNRFLAGFEVIDAAKAAVEAVCPGVVSCADIIAYAARDSTVKLNGSSWIVQGGRTDGCVSKAENAEAEIPRPEFQVSELIESFASKGLTSKEMVVLSGSHTVGVSHCESIVGRLYNFNATFFTDPTIDPEYAEELKLNCPQFTFNDTIEVFMDVVTPGEFDSNYYTTLTQNKGLFTSDQSLYLDGRTKPVVEQLLQESPFDFEFGRAMISMGNVQIKYDGQIRQNCRVSNT